jgi:hypothetical protein
MNKKSYRRIHRLYPWYLNNTLDDNEKICVEKSLHNDVASVESMNDWRRIQNALHSRAMYTPEPILQQRILARIRSDSVSSVFKAHPLALVLAFVICVLLWTVVRPGIALQWNVENDSVQTFRVYRAVQGEADYQLLRELPASADLNKYAYVDMQMLPWQKYSYVVEGIREGGILALSQTVTGRAIDALPGQLALMSASLFVGYLIAYLGGFIFRKKYNTHSQAV